MGSKLSIDVGLAAVLGIRRPLRSLPAKKPTKNNTREATSSMPTVLNWPCVCVKVVAGNASINGGETWDAVELVSDAMRASLVEPLTAAARGVGLACSMAGVMMLAGSSADSVSLGVTASESMATVGERVFFDRGFFFVFSTAVAATSDRGVGDCADVELSTLPLIRNGISFNATR